LRHDEVPPEVTVGEEELVVGVEDEEEEEEDAPVLPVVPVLPDEERPLFDVVDVPGVDVVVVAFFSALAPWESWDTTIPMATVAPVAASTAPRVRMRSRDLALSLAAGVLGSVGAGMGFGLLLWRRPYRTMTGSTLTQDRLWARC
jgi:hypothetical protein